MTVAGLASAGNANFSTDHHPLLMKPTLNAMNSIFSRLFALWGLVAVLLTGVVPQASAVGLNTTGSAGSSSPVDMTTPTIAAQWMIATEGIFPSRDANPFGGVGDDSVLLGEIRCVGYNYDNYGGRGYLPCDGRLLSIAQYSALFSLLGTRFGGNGTSNFGLPDLRGRVPIGASQNLPVGSLVGAETVTLTQNQIPSHTHTVPGGATNATGGGQSIPNRQPGLALTICTEAIGIFQSMGWVRIFPYNFTPSGFYPGTGGLESISNNEALYAKIGTTYGGDGQTTFGLPDFRERMLIGTGQGPGLSARALGQTGGADSVTLSTPQMPAHVHTITSGNTGSTGGTAAVSKLQPSIALTPAIAVSGIYNYSDSEPAIGEIRFFACANLLPNDFVPAAGQILQRTQYQALFSLIFNLYGGDGVNNFALPDLRGRALASVGGGPGLTLRTFGNTWGTESVTLTSAQLPAHTHTYAGAATPSVSASTGSLSLGTTTFGTAGTAQNFTVNGSNLTASLIVTAPTGVEVSLSSGTGYGSSVSLTPSSGTVSTTTIYARIPASASLGAVSGNITVASAGATTQNVSVSGTVNASSNADLSALSFSAGSISFSAGTTSYSFNVPDTTASTTVTATKADANATLQLQANGGGFTALTSGVTSSPLSLNVGPNTIDVKVTAQDGTTTKTYTTTITRAAPVFPTSTTVTSSNPTPTYGDGVTLTATITSTGGTPSGTVEFVIDGATVAATAPVVSGAATLITYGLSATTVSPHTVVANYTPAVNSGYLGSSGSLAGGHSVAQRAVTVSGLVVPPKVADGSANTTIDFTNATLENTLASDAGNVSLSTIGYTAVFADALPGVSKRVTVSGLALTGSAAGNYAFTPPERVFGTITEAPSLTVTTSADLVDDTDSLTSLREAIAYAATLEGPQTIRFYGEAIAGAAAAADGAENFYDGAVHTIVLTGGELTVTSALEIVGPGANVLTIDANFGGRSLNISGGETFAVSGIQFTNGSPGAIEGGAILVSREADGSVRVADCVFSDNTTSSSGGAIFNYADFDTTSILVVTGSTFLRNSATGRFGSGGAIALQGGSRDLGGTAILRVENCTFAENSAPTGGSLYISGSGGTGRATIRHSTFAGGSSSEGGTDVYANHHGTIELGSNIFASESPAVVAVGDGVITSLGYNLTAGSDGPNNETTDRIETDPLLQPLGFNGGTTQTYALGEGSPAINAGGDLARVGTEVVVTDSETRLPLLTVDEQSFEAQSIPVGSLLKLDSEIVRVTGYFAADTLTIERAVGGTAPAAHDSGTAVNFAYDQRGAGFDRVLNGRIDIGAFETTVEAVPAATVYLGPNDGGSIVPNNVEGDPAFDFGDVATDESATQTFTLKNTGTATLHISSIALAGGFSGGFDPNFSVIATNPPEVLEPGATYTFTVDFHPGEEGPLQAIVRVLSDDPAASNYRFPVSGTGITPSVRTRTIFTTDNSGGGGGGGSTPQTQVPGEPEGTTFASFGIPAINDAGGLAFLTTIQPGNVSAIFAGNGILARKGGASPGSTGTLVPAVRFNSFTDPAMAPGGAVAFRATLSTGGTAIFANLGGTLRRVVGIGDLATGLGRVPPKFTTLTAFTITDNAVFISAYVKGSTGFQSLWSWTPTAGLRLLLYPGLYIDGKQVTQFFGLDPEASAPGHGRSSRDGEAIVRVRFRDGSQSPAIVNAGGGARVLATSNIQGPFTSFADPVLNSQHHFAVSAKVKNPRATHAVASQDDVILSENGGGLAPALSESALIGLLRVLNPSAPVLNASGSIATLSTLTTATGAVSTPRALLYKPFGATPTPLAKIGGDATDVPGAKWSNFRSIALPDGLGPIFLGTLQIGPGGVTAADALGLWALDSTGLQRLLIREGTEYEGRTIRTLTLLSRVLASPDQTRSFNGARQIALKATFTDNTQAIVVIGLSGPRPQ